MVDIADSAVSNAGEHCGYQWVYGPLPATEISGTVSMKMRGKITTYYMNVGSCAIWLAKPDGTLRSTLCNAGAYNDDVYFDVAYAAYTWTVTLTAQTPTAGDYLVLELGWDSSGFTETETCTIEIGDTNSTNRGYFQFSGTITSIVPPTTLTYDHYELDAELDEAAHTNNATANGDAPLVFAIGAGAFPTGLTLDEDTGAVAGTPTVGAEVTVATVTVSNGGGSKTSLPITYKVSFPYLYQSSTVKPNVAITDNTCDHGGTPTFTIKSGSLPTGLALASDTGTISGTPTVEGVFSAVIRATTGSLYVDSEPVVYTVSKSRSGSINLRFDIG